MVAKPELATLRSDIVAQLIQSLNYKDHYA